MKKQYIYIFLFYILSCLYQSTAIPCTHETCPLPITNLGKIDIVASPLNTELKSSGCTKPTDTGCQSNALSVPGSRGNDVYYTAERPVTTNVGGSGCGGENAKVTLAVNGCGGEDKDLVARCLSNQITVEMEVNPVLALFCVPANSLGGWLGISQVHSVKEVTNKCWTVKRRPGGEEKGITVAFDQSNSGCVLSSRQNSKQKIGSKAQSAGAQTLQVINSRARVTSPNGAYHTEFRKSDSFTSYFAIVNDSRVTWSTGLMTDGATYPDTLTLLDNGFAVFESTLCSRERTFGTIGPVSGSVSKFVLTDNGVLEIVNQADKVVWASNRDTIDPNFFANVPCDRISNQLKQGEVMIPGSKLVSANGDYVMEFNKSKLCTSEKDATTPKSCSDEFFSTSAANGQKAYANLLLNNGSDELLLVATDECPDGKKVVIASAKLGHGNSGVLALSDNGDLVFRENSGVIRDVKFEHIPTFTDCIPRLRSLNADSALTIGAQPIESPSKQFYLSMEEGKLCIYKKNNTLDVQQHCTPIFRSTEGVFADTFVFGGDKADTYITNSECPNVKFAIPNPKIIQDTPDGGISIGDIIAQGSKMEVLDNGIVSIISDDPSHGGMIGIQPTDFSGISGNPLFITNPNPRLVICKTQGLQKHKNKKPLDAKLQR